MCGQLRSPRHDVVDAFAAADAAVDAVDVGAVDAGADGCEGAVAVEAAEVDLWKCTPPLERRRRLRAVRREIAADIGAAAVTVVAVGLNERAVAT